MFRTHFHDPPDDRTQLASTGSQRRLHTALRVVGWTVLGLVGLLLCALIVLSLVDWSGMRGPVARFAAARLHRDVRIDGPLRVHVFSRTPSIDVQGLHIGNPDWLPRDSDFFSASRVQAALLASQLLRLRVAFDRIEVDEPFMNLVQDQMNRANWQFSPAKKDDAAGTQIPPIRQFTLRGGNLQVDDRMHGVRFTGGVVASQQSSGSAPFQLQGKGEFNQSPFTLEFSGNPLVNIRIDAPYEFRATAIAGATRATLNGSIDRPFDLGRFSAGVEASGRNLADLYYLTGLALPRTPQYQVRLQLRRDRTQYTARDIVGTIGQSDVHGTAGVDLRGARPLLTAKVQSRSLRLRDLGVAFGASADQPPPQKAALLLPDEPFEFTRLNQMDARVDFRADSVQTVKVPLQAVALNVLLRDGVLRLDPAVLTLPQGRLSGTAVLDTHPRPAAVSIDARLDDVQLEQFRKKNADAPLKGVLRSHVVVEGRGNSLHAVASSGHGQLTAVLPHGEIREALAELTGINVLRGLGLLVGGKDRTAAVRCGVAQFTLDHGVAQSDRILFDTENVSVEGKGRIELGDESLHLDFTGHPKSVRLLRLRTPINVRGTMAKPAIGIDAGSALKQGGAAAALSALTPIAAILAFVDRGLAQDENCAALLAQANDDSNRPQRH